MDNKQLDFLDLLNIMSFIVGLMNLDENLTQIDKQELIEVLNTKFDELKKEITYQNELLIDIYKKVSV